MAVYYQQLLRAGTFNALASEQVASLLAEAIQADYPNQAQEIREWTTATRQAMLGVLDDLAEAGDLSRHTTLWRASQLKRQAECAAVYLPQGIDVRLLIDGDADRTSLVANPWLAEEQAAVWLRGLLASDWTLEPDEAPSRS